MLGVECVWITETQISETILFVHKADYTFHKMHMSQLSMNSF